MNNLLKMMLLGPVTVVSLVANAGEQMKSIAAGQVELLARQAVVAEVESFNEAMVNGERPDGYRGRLIQYMVNNGKTNIDPEFMVDKCTLTEGNIVSMLSSTLSSGDDALAARKNGLANVKGNYNTKIWRILSVICEHARDRFVDRLATATQNGVGINLDAHAINDTAHILFYPTDFGHATFTKLVTNTFNQLLNGAALVGASSIVAGIPVGGMILAVVGVINGSRNVFQNLKGKTPFNYGANSDGLIQLQEIRIDL